MGEAVTVRRLTLRIALVQEQRQACPGQRVLVLNPHTADPQGVVLFLYCDELYNENTERRGIADVLIAKHRHGPTGSVPLLFRKPTASFVEA